MGLNRDRDQKKLVSHISDDDILFEHEFSHMNYLYFSLLNILHVLNFIPQTLISNKVDSNDQQLYSIDIEYFCLGTLGLQLVHQNNSDQFLNSKKTYLSFLIKLIVTSNKSKITTRQFYKQKKTF